MGIRGDMEARYWAEYGHEKPREWVEHFFDCLKDPSFWLKLYDDGYTEEQIMTFLDIVDLARKRFLTVPSA